MNKAVIWDLDGTLLDSYHVIVDSVILTFAEFGIECAKEEIHRIAIHDSISGLFQQYGNRVGVDPTLLSQRYSEISASRYQMIRAEKQACEVLRALKEKGVAHYVFTHRGKTTLPVLDHLNMTSHFQQIITSQSGFQRKPNPEGLNYLIDTNNLDRNQTYYVGDRKLDMECARNAGITGILYIPEGGFDVSGDETYRVKELVEILDIV